MSVTPQSVFEALSSRDDLAEYGSNAIAMLGLELRYRKALSKRLNAEGPMRPAAIDALAQTLAAALPPA
jgi:hypothetical protein